MTLHSESLRSQKGLTLVEIMVAITISLVLLAGVIKIFQSAKQSYNIQQALSRVQENARLMTDVMIWDITASGYLGCLGASNEVTNTLSDQGKSYDFAAAIQGAEGGSGNSDSIIIRRASEATAIPVIAPMAHQEASLALDSTHMNYASLQQWDVVTVSDCAGAAVFMITNNPDNTGVIEHDVDTVATSGANTGQSNADDDLNRIFGSPSTSTAKIYRVGTTSYQVLPSSSGRPTTSLFVSPGGELVEGVEDLQIQYGLGSTPPNNSTPAIAEQYVDADQVTDWNDVVSIRLTFVVNSVDMIVNPGDGDGLLRKTFTSTIRLRNRAPA
ncbi:MAG: PilW family protein [Gammaproteobacteria bacterium]|nr:PilW family protein [Gammaproteobacteria bacterium]